MKKISLSPIKIIIQEAKRGKIFILVDNKNRENEGDLVIPASKANSKSINFMDKRVLLRHSGSYVFCMENQQHLLDSIGPMYVQQEQQKAAAGQANLTPDTDGNVTLDVNAVDMAPPVVNEATFEKPGK